MAVVSLTKQISQGKKKQFSSADDKKYSPNMLTLINKKLQSVRREDGARGPPAPNGKKKPQDKKNKEESPKVILKPSAGDLKILLLPRRFLISHI